MEDGKTLKGRKVQKPLARTAELWPSPIATEARQGFQDRTRGKKGKQESLTTRTVRWPTPNVRDHHAQGLTHNTAARSSSLATMVARDKELWPTPRTITGGAESAQRKKELGRRNSGGGDLQAAAKTWPTPRTSDYKSGQVSEKTFSKNSRPLNEVACHCSHLVPETPKCGRKSSKMTRRLNPRFVTWLMGWPLTDSGFLATEWSHYRQRMRSSLFGLLSTIRKPHD